MSQKPLTYKDAGVSIDAGNALEKAIGPLARSTARPGADAELGGFGGFFGLRAAGYEDPLLVAATGGVGTRLKLATGCWGWRARACTATAFRSFAGASRRKAGTCNGRALRRTDERSPTLCSS